MQQARPKLHIEAVVAKVVRWLFVIVGALLSAVGVLSVIRGVPLIEMIPLMLVLLMSAVPVALPVMFTVSMAVGSKELAKRGVLVTRLSAAEDAATMDVLCVDKTGTTFSFLTLLYFAVFSIVSARERRWFWTTMPSKTLVAALVADALAGTVLTFVGLPGLMPLPGWQILAVFGYAMAACLIVNDAVKVVMIRQSVSSARA